MDGQKAILSKILDEARAKADDIFAEAEKKCADKISEAKNWVVEYTDAQNGLLKNETEAILSGKKLNAELEAKKAVLKAKREVLDEVFNSAYEKLCKTDKRTYLNFVLRLIDDYAEDGDEIILSCDNILVKEDFDLKKFKIKNLVISEHCGKFKGGVMLIGKNSDKDLTFKSIVDSKKEGLTSFVANLLFKV